MCIDVVEIWFGITDGQISSDFDKELSARDKFVFSFLDDNFSKYPMAFHQTWRVQ